MTSRDLSINTSQGISSVGGLPTPSNSEGPFFTSTLEGTVPTATLSHPTSLAIPSVSYPTSQRAHAPTLLRQHSFSGTDDDAAVASFANMNRRPSLPISNLHHHPMERQPSYDPRRQPGYLGHHPSIQQSQAHQPLTPLTPTLISPSSTSSTDDYFAAREVRHPLWRLECKVCATVLCEQAMQGHLVDDPSQRLFSTNLAIGVQASPGYPPSKCPCKFQYFACGSCESVCGYSLIESCSECQFYRGNGHFWVFYSHEVNAHWRTIEMENDPENNIHSHIHSKGARSMFWDDLPTQPHNRHQSNSGP